MVIIYITVLGITYVEKKVLSWVDSVVKTVKMAKKKKKSMNSKATRELGVDKSL